MKIDKLRWKLAYTLRNLADKLYDADKETPCEACWKIHSYEVSTSSEDGCYFCPECVAQYDELPA